jgi:hypothetical protein
LKVNVPLPILTSAFTSSAKKIEQAKRESKIFFIIFLINFKLNENFLEVLLIFLKSYFSI